MRKENRFGEYIVNLRKEKQISLNQLSDGLCDPSLLHRFERGEREAPKLLQNRILTRLGAVPENYENFLYYKEYCRWEKRQGILHYILEENMEEAKGLLEAYRLEYDMTEPLEKQFYLAMLVQIRRYEGAGDEEIGILFKEALELTVPEIEERGFRGRILSLEELNLLLEYMHCQNFFISLLFYEELLEYIETMDGTQLAMAKIYPKAVYYYYTTWKQSQEQSEEQLLRLLELCDKAIELLRNANRMFYLWELFCMKEELIPMLPEKMSASPEICMGLEQCRNWRETLEEIYREYGCTIAMYEFCYLYVESENYCIGDVIRIRRKMLGMSMHKLCDGICTERTVSRLERNETEPRKDIVRKLFDRLNLSTELCRTELVTDSQEAIRLYEELKLQIDNQNSESVAHILEQLKTLVSLDIPTNYQAIYRNEIISEDNAGKITKEEYIMKMKMALEKTVSYQAAISLGDKYLTNEEISCVQNIMVELDIHSSEIRKCVTSLEDYCNGIKYPRNYFRVYEFIMAAVSSYYGDIGEYENSDEIKSRIIKLSLQSRRIRSIHGALYGMQWNREHKMRKEVGEKSVQSIIDLKKCIQFARLCKDIYRISMYKMKLDEK